MACITKCCPQGIRSPEIKPCRFWASTGQYEPSILERSVAISYLILGREVPWLARLFNSIFWTLGGVALFDLARRMAKYAMKEDSQATSERIAFICALVALAYYLVLPFSVQASRSFQPDPAMTVWITLAAYAAYRWSESSTWKWTFLTGAFSGMAILTKAVAFYPIAGILILIAIHTFRERFQASQKGLFFSAWQTIAQPTNLVYGSADHFAYRNLLPDTRRACV